MTDLLHLPARHRGQLEVLFREHLPDIEVWAYGSRVDGRSHDGSDLDLVLRGPGLEEIDLTRLTDFQQALHDSTIPFVVEARDWARLPERFHREIEREYVVLVAGEPSPSGDDGEPRGDCAPRPTRSSGERENWAMLRFRTLLQEPVRNGIYKRREHRGHGAKIVNMAELFAHPRLRAVPMRRVELSESELERFSLLEGDLLFARRSLVAEGAGRCCVVLALDEPTTFESSIIRARPDPTRADSLYLYYFFNSPLGLHLLDTIRRQVAVAGITGGDLSELRIPVPPTAVQHDVAGVLGTLDDKIEVNREMTGTLESMARVLFKSWFVNFDPVRAKMEGRDTGLPGQIADLFPARLVHSDLGEIPEGWQAGTLADIADLNPESWSRRNTPDEVRYVDLANTKWGFIELVKQYQWESAPSRARRVLRPYDTIVGTVRPGNGSFALVDRDGLTGSTGFAVLRPKASEEREIVYCAATSRGNVDRLARMADGGAYPAVNPTTVLDTAVVLPERCTRRAFSSLAAPLLKRLQETRREARALDSVRSALLPSLVSGETQLRESAIEDFGA